MTAFLGNIMGSILKFVYDLVSSIGQETEYISYYAIAVIITSVIFKLILLPISLQQSKSQKKMQEMQPLTKQLQDKYKNDPQTMQTKLSELYKEHNYNPSSGCLVLLIQFPIIIAFFAVFREPATYAFKEPGFYEAMNKTFLWISSLEFPDPLIWGMPLLSALTTYLQTKTMPTVATGDAAASQTQKTMNYMMPLMIFFITKSFPAGLALYWVVGNTFTIIQQLISNRSLLMVKEEK